MPDATALASQAAAEPSPRPLRHSARRINQLAEALDAQTYLEIGVFAGETFTTVNLPRRTAVDPKFRFDWRALRSESVDLHQTTSDAWFTSEAQGRRFDIIFIDGLHTFEQTFRDFCNSLSVAHDRTVWLIDDTVPIDVYSAWPHEREAKDARRNATALVRGDATSKVMKSWHGDVYKVVFAIHDFFPMLSFCTFETDNGQTLVWREPRMNFRPLFNNLETISRLNFFDFKRNEAVLDRVSEAEALGRVVRALGGSQTAATSVTL